MSKNKIGYFVFAFAMALICLSFFPAQNIQRGIVAETQGRVFSLVPKNYNKNPDQTFSNYNIKNANLDPFTPFDFEKEKRMEGSSFGFDKEEYCVIKNQEVKVDRHEDIKATNQLALEVWIFFDKTMVHSLSLCLELENGENVVWTLSSSDLYSLLNKNGAQMAYPYGWNKFTLPLCKGTKSANFLSGEFLSAPEKVIVNYESQVQNQNMSSIVFYDLCLNESSDVQEIKAEKQSYVFASYYFIEEQAKENLCQGDDYLLPSFSRAVKFAYEGKRNLIDLGSPENKNIQWKVVVSSPSETKTYSFGDRIVFDEEGSYEIFYRCYDIVDSKSTVIMSAQTSINISRLNGVFFSKSEMKMEVGKTYVLNLSTSSLFSETSNVELEFDKKVMDAKIEENGKVSVSVKKTGETSLKAKIFGKRTNSTEFKEYETTLKITAQKSSQKDYRVLRIVLWCIIGTIFLSFLVSVVILLVKSRKISVK